MTLTLLFTDVTLPTTMVTFSSGETDITYLFPIGILAADSELFK